MSKEIDEKVVQMRFDNAEFEKNINQTIKSVKKLETSLELEGAEDGLDNAEKSSKKLSKSVDKAAKRFSAFEIIATTALATVTNKIVNVGLQLIKSLSVDQISSGWAKYEDQLTTVGGIINNVKKEFNDLEEANAAVAAQMQKLLEYSDETSFSFTTMSNAIKQFTTAGIELEKASNAAVGVTLVAGASKVFDNFKISSAMNAVSKSMQQGYMDLMKWNTLTQTSGIVTTEFAQALMDAAVAEGKLIKNQAGDYATKKGGKRVTTENIASTLHDRWMTADVVTSVLNKYSEANVAVQQLLDEGLAETASRAIDMVEAMSETDQIEKFGKVISELSIQAYKSSQEATTLSQAIQSVKDAISTQFMLSFQELLGDTQEATKLWTDVANTLYDVFVPAFSSVTEILKNWHEEFGTVEKDGKKITKFGLVIEKVFEIIAKFNEAFKEAFMETFHLTDEYIGNAAKAFDNFMEKILGVLDSILQNDGLIATFKTLNKVLFNVLRVAGKVASTVFRFIGKILDYLSPAIDVVNQVLDTVGEVIYEILELITRGNISGYIESFTFAIKKLFNYILSVFPPEVADKVRQFFSDMIDFFKSVNIVDTFTNAIEKLKDAFFAVIEWFKNFKDNVLNLFDTIKNKAIEFYNNLKSNPMFSWIPSVIDWIYEKIIFIKDKIVEVFESISNTLNKDGDPFEKFVEIMTTLKDFLVGAGVIVLLFSLGRLFRSLTWVMDGVYQFLSTNKVYAVARVISSIGVVILAVAVLIRQMSKIENTDVMVSTVAATLGLIGVLTLALWGLYAILTQVDLTKKIRIAGILRFGIAMWLYLTAIKSLLGVMKDIDQTELQNATGIIAELSLIFVGMFAAIGMLSKFMGGMLGKVIAVTISIYIATVMFDTIQDLLHRLDVTFETIAEIIDKLVNVSIKWGLLVLVITLIISVARAIVAIMNRNKEYIANSLVRNIIEMVASFGLIIAAITILMKEINSIPEINWDAWKRLLMIGALMTVVTGLMIGLNWVTRRFKDAGVRGNGVVQMMVSFIMSLLSLALAIKLLSMIDTDSLWKALGAIAALGAVALGVTAVLAILGSKKHTGTINSALVTVAAIVALVYILANEDLAPYVKTAIGVLENIVAMYLVFIGVITIIYGIVEHADKKEGKESGGLTKFMLSMTALFAVMIGSVIGLLFAIKAISESKDINYQIFYSSFAMVAAIIVLCTGMYVWILKNIDNLMNQKSKTGHKEASLLLASFLGILALVDIMLLSFAALFHTMGNIKNPGSFGIAAGVLVLLVATIITCVVLLYKHIKKTNGINKQAWASFASIAGGLSAIALSVAALMFVLNAVKMDWSWVGKILAFAALLAIMLGSLVILDEAAKQLNGLTLAKVGLLTGAIVILGLSIAIIMMALNGVKTEGLAGKIVAIVVVLVALAAFIFMLVALANSGVGTAALVIIDVLVAAIAAIIIGLASIFHEINAIDPEKIYKAIVGLVSGLLYIVANVAKASMGMAFLTNFMLGFKDNSKIGAKAAKDIEKFNTQFSDFIKNLNSFTKWDLTRYVEDMANNINKLTDSIKKATDREKDYNAFVEIFAKVHDSYKNASAASNELTKSLESIRNLAKALQSDLSFTITLRLDTSVLNEQLRQLNTTTSAGLAFAAAAGSSNPNSYYNSVMTNSGNTTTTNYNIFGGRSGSNSYMARVEAERTAKELAGLTKR